MRTQLHCKMVVIKGKSSFSPPPSPDAWVFEDVALSLSKLIKVDKILNAIKNFTVTMSFKKNITYTMHAMIG